MHPPESFVEHGDTQAPIGAEETGWPVRLREDYVVLGLFVAALLVNIGLFGFLVLRYNSLPDPLALHFDAAGLPDRIEAKNGIVALPVIGLIVMVLNTVLGALAYRRERAATILLVIGALFVAVLMWLATINIAGGLFGT